MKKFLSLAIILILFLNLNFNIKAQESITLTAIPARLGDDHSLMAKPGEKLQTTLQVKNSSDQEITVRTQAADFILEDGQTPIEITTDLDNYRWSLKNWLSIYPEKQTLKPGETKQINLIINTPSDALPGGHYAMITHSPVSGANGASGSGISQKVGTLLYVLVEGPINEEAFIRSVNFPKFSEYGPVPFSFTIDNQSDVHLRPQIKIEIYNLFNQLVDTIKLEPKNIFPLMSRDFTGQFDRIWGSGFYKAKIIASYGSSGQIAQANANFYLLPIKILIAVLIIILNLIIILIAIRRHLKNKHDKQI